ncbi:MAG: hypothetical protein IKL00_08385 [Oscillospiraceae bacterium]|nr:hypothetical protein [Oscillospiraceae bacterium]
MGVISRKLSREIRTLLKAPPQKHDFKVLLHYTTDSRKVQSSKTEKYINGIEIYIASEGSLGYNETI